MGINDRKEREKEELRSLILAAARSLFLEKGVEKTSIRNIADKIEYSPGIIYHYFKDKNEIFHSLHQEGFLQLLGKMKVLGTVENPLERLKAMGKIYMSFAKENPDMYDLMFIKEAPIDHIAHHKEEDWKEGNNTFSFLRSTVQECIDIGNFKGHDVEALTYMIWSTVHGMVSLRIRGRCEAIYFENQDTIMEEAYLSFTKILDSF
ncbi:TetR/AcrR family transcriptional regulator [Algoriphagus sp.]|uniref:TetR/AcrR family transcriptional regulator n=1 Tax=Algoriphagus sp. TaxID=1872435 RepID=UPI0025D41354|nr:TetR/AcrR family transcriptional regulator [Algoriphagus sp.]